MKKLIYSILLIACFNSYFSIIGNKIKYNMSIDFDVSKHQFSGTQKITYYNNSPENLSTLYMHLYYNAFQPGSMMDVRSRTIEDPDSELGIEFPNFLQMKLAFKKLRVLKMEMVTVYHLMKMVLY